MTADRVRGSVVVASLVFAAGLPVSRANAQSWNAAVSGSWFDPLRWSPNAVPTGAGAVGTLGLSGPYDVTTTSNTISGVNITNPAARLLIGGNSVLTLTGTSSIDGQIVVNGAAVYQLCTLTIAGPVVLNGAGSLVLNASPSDPAGTVGTASVNASGPGTLTLGSGFTLGGFGKVASVTTFNSGTVSANAPGRPLVITGGAHLNNGLYTAGGTSELRVSNAPVTQGPGGSIVPAPGGTVTLTDSPLSGGSVTGTPTGRVQLGGVSDVDGVTVHGGLDLLPGFAGRLGAAGLALGNGTVTVNSSAGYVGTSLRATVANTPVTGTGVLLLNASPGDAAAGAGTSLLSKVNNSSGSFSFGPGVTVAGFGWINGVDTTINGQVLANVDGRPLRIDGGLHQNNGVMGALAGGSLLIAGATISQSDGASVYAAGSGAGGNSVARLTNCTVTGGSLADVQLWATDTLSVNSLGGTVIVEPGALLQFAIPSVTMADAVLLVNPAGVYSGTVARVDGPFTFTGTGQVRLNASPSDPNATAGTANLAGTAGASLTFAPGVTLSGFGMINDLPTVNDSVFTADVSGRPLRFNGSTHQNNGVYRAVGGGRLVFAGATVHQAGGAQVSVGDGSAAVFTSSTVTGGAVGSPAGGTGTVSLDSGEQHFDGVTVSGQVSLAPGGTLFTTGLTLAGNAQVTINNGAYSGTALLAAGSPTVLSGSGTVHLRASASDPNATAGTADLRAGAPGASLVISPGVTVEGFGQVVCPAVNNGVIEANQAGRPVRFSTYGQQNNGAYRAVNGASLVFAGTQVNQAPGGVVSLVEGSTLRLEAGAVSGGTILSADSTGAITLTGTGTLADLTFQPPVAVPAGAVLTLAGAGVTANGRITVNPTGDYSGTALAVSGAGFVLAGSGGVNLHHSTSDPNTTAGTAALRGVGGASTLTMGAAQSLIGGGRIQLPVTNQGVTSPGAGAGSIDLFTIQSSASLTMTGTSELQIEIGPSGFDRIVNEGTFAAAGRVRVTALPGFTGSVGAVFDVLTGGTTSGGFSRVISQGGNPPRRFGVRVDPGRVRVTVLCGLADIGSVGADPNGDGRLDNNDFIVFIDRFFSQDTLVDLGTPGGVQGSDGVFDNNDFIAFIDLFFAGCP